MRIISRFRDYYDHVSPGDRAPVWTRTTEYRWITLPTGERPDPLLRELCSMPASIELAADHRPIVLAFCGRIWRGYTNTDDHLWTAEALEALLRQRWSREVGRKKAEGVLPYQMRRFLGAASTMMATQPKISAEHHRTWGSPLVALREAHPRHLRLTISPCLELWGFPAVVDAETAWQELDMYLGNQLARQPDPPQPRSQELIRDARGFDARSFKSDTPGEKKQRRRANRARKRRGD